MSQKVAMDLNARDLTWIHLGEKKKKMSWQLNFITSKAKQDLQVVSVQQVVVFSKFNKFGG